MRGEGIHHSPLASQISFAAAAWTSSLFSPSSSGAFRGSRLQLFLVSSLRLQGSRLVMESSGNSGWLKTLCVEGLQDGCAIQLLWKGDAVHARKCTSQYVEWCETAAELQVYFLKNGKCRARTSINNINSCLDTSHSVKCIWTVDSTLQQRSPTLQQKLCDVLLQQCFCSVGVFQEVPLIYSRTWTWSQRYVYYEITDKAFKW